MQFEANKAEGMKSTSNGIKTAFYDFIRTTFI